jgi:hypothetical protein
VAVINGDQSLLQGLPTNTYPFALVADKDAASLVWDAAAKEALFGQDVIARNVEAADIPNVVASIGALAELKRMSEANSTTFRLLPNNQIHREGETVTLDAPEINDNYLIVFDLTGDGTLQVLYPFTKEEKASPKVSEGWHIDNKVQEPYGADSVVVISSPVALLDLQNALISRNNTKFAGKLIETIKYYTGTRQNIKIGITKLVTAPRS